MKLPTVWQSDKLAKSSSGMQIFCVNMITEFPSVQQRELFSQVSLEMPLFRLIEIMELPIVRQSDAKIQKRWVKSLQLYLTRYPNSTFVLSFSCIWCYKVVYIHENWFVNLWQRIISALIVSPYTSLHRSRELNFHQMLYTRMIAFYSISESLNDF